MNNTLLPCPFCGGNDIQIDEMESFWDKNETSWRVLCIDCIAETAGDTKEQAIAAWNRRADHIRDTTKKVSNADRMRSMSDEELARWLDSLFKERRDDWKPIGCYNCINYGTHHSDPANKGTRLYECDGCDFEGNQENGYKYGILNWLQQPAKEEHHENY